MKTKFGSNVRGICHSFGGTVCAGAILLMAASASAQNLFVSNYGSDEIYQFTPGGALTTYANGMNYPFGLAFNSAGDLFVANSANNSGVGGTITEITPGGAKSTFASGLDTEAIAVNNAGVVYAADYRSGVLYKYSGGVQSTVANGFSSPISLAVDNSGDVFVGAGYGNGNGYITEITPGGAENVIGSGLSFPAGLAVNNLGDVFAASQSSGTIYEFTPGGTEIVYANLSASYVNGLAIDVRGRQVCRRQWKQHH